MKAEDYLNRTLGSKKVDFLKGETTKLDNRMIIVYNETRKVYEEIFSNLSRLEDLASRRYIRIGKSEIYPEPYTTQDSMVSVFAFIAKEELGIDFYINEYQLETHTPYQCPDAVYERYERLARDKEDDLNEIFMQAVDQTLENVATRGNKPSSVALPQFWIDNNQEFLNGLEHLSITYKVLEKSIVLLTLSIEHSEEIVPDMLLKYLKENK